MRPLSPKQREIRARDALILDEAQRVLLDGGLAALTMERVAERVGVSRGTVSQHYTSKEDLLAAVALRTSDLRASLFERAALFRGSSRERMAAVGIAAEVFWGLYPEHQQAERTIKSTSFASKISPKRAQGLANGSFRCFGAAMGIVRDALASGDLALPESSPPEQLCVGLWNLYIGASVMRDLEMFLDEPLLRDPMPIIHANASVRRDGCGWKPLSSEHDAGALRERVLREVFADEARELGLVDAG